MSNNNAVHFQLDDAYAGIVQLACAENTDEKAVMRHANSKEVAEALNPVLQLHACRHPISWTVNHRTLGTFRNRITMPSLLVYKQQQKAACVSFQSFTNSDRILQIAF